jgi:hypothetical protein
MAALLFLDIIRSRILPTASPAEAGDHGTRKGRSPMTMSQIVIALDDAIKAYRANPVMDEADLARVLGDHLNVAELAALAAELGGLTATRIRYRGDRGRHVC